MQLFVRAIERLTDQGRQIRQPLLLTFVVFWLTSISISFYSTLKNADEILNQATNEQFERAFLYYDEQINAQANLQEVALYSLSTNHQLINALRSEATSNIAVLADPIFARLNKVNLISHFYFIKPSREVIYRAHSPQRNGDLINRHTLLTAESEKRTVSGLEFGKLGMFTLRSVTPIVVEGQLLGYLELGMEVGHVIQQTERQFNIDIVEIINKEFIKSLNNTSNSSARERILEITERHTDQQSISDYFVTYGKSTEFGQQELTAISAMVHQKQLHDELSRNKVIQGRKTLDFSGSHLGYLAILSDMSHAAEVSNQYVFNEALIQFLILVAGLIIFNFVIKLMEKQIANYRNYLNAQKEDLQNTLTQLKSTQGELIEKEKFAALGNLVAGVAHEVNTPIGLGVTASTFLKDRVIDLNGAFTSQELTSAQLKKFIKESKETSDIIYTNLERAADLVSSFKQVAVDQTNDEARTFNVKQVIDEVVLSLRPKLKKTNHNIEIKCDKDLHVKTKPGPINQILINLITNSLIHGFEHRDDGCIKISIDFAEGILKLNYLDNGKGLDTEIVDRVFEPFTTTKRGEGGSGLGMHLIYNIVTQIFNGEVNLNKSLNSGFEININIPVTEYNH